MAATNDVMQAVVTAWLANGSLQAAFRGGPLPGDIPSTQDGNYPIPYVGMKTKTYKNPQYSSGGTGVHYIWLGLTAWGKKADANSLVGTIATAFGDGSQNVQKPLTVPNSTWLRTETLEPGRLELFKEGRTVGEEIWKGIVEYVLWLQRATP